MRRTPDIVNVRRAAHSRAQGAAGQIPARFDRPELSERLQDAQDVVAESMQAKDT